jgi:hypothetical protein
MAALGRHLLYCESVAIDDPIWWLTCDTIDLADADGRQKLRALRETVLRGLRFLSLNRSLITAGRLVLVPYVHSLHLMQWRNYAVTAADIASVDETEVPPNFNDEVDDYQKGLWLEIALDQMSAQVQVATYFENRLDFTTNHQVHQQALAKLLNEVPDPTDAERLRTLACLPTLSVRTDARSLIDLARTNDAFAAWRLGMGRALDKIARLDNTQADFAVRARRTFEEELFDAVTALRKEAETAQFGKLLRPRLEDIALGSVGTGVVIATAFALGMAATPLSLAGVAAAQGTKLIWTYARGGGARAQAKAADELYHELGPINNP